MKHELFKREVAGAVKIHLYNKDAAGRDTSGRWLSEVQWADRQMTKGHPPT